MEDYNSIRNLEKVLQQALNNTKTISENAKAFHDSSGLSSQKIKPEIRFSPIVKEKIREISNTTGIPLPVLQYYFFGTSWNYY